MKHCKELEFLNHVSCFCFNLIQFCITCNTSYIWFGCISMYVSLYVCIPQCISLCMSLYVCIPLFISLCMYLSTDRSMSVCILFHCLTLILIFVLMISKLETPPK